MSQLPTGYNFAQNLVASGAANSRPDDVFQTNGGLGVGIKIKDMRDFFATNPSDDEILKQASNYGMSQEELARALVYGRGDTLDDIKTNAMINGSSNYGYDNDGRIVALNGAPKFAQNGSSALTKYDPSSSGSSGYGGSYGSSSSSSSTSGGLNPYLDQMAQSITNQMNTNWSRNLEPSIRSGAMAAGGFGGSRQGVVEANGLRDMNQTLGNSLANLYGTGWQNAQQNALQKQSLDNSYDLGIRNNNLGFANLDSNNAQFGANLNLNTLNAMNNWAQNGVNAANQMYQMPLYYQNMFNNMQNNISGQGGSTSQTNQGNPGLGFLGGWQLANGWGK